MRNWLSITENKSGNDTEKRKDEGVVERNAGEDKRLCLACTAASFAVANVRNTDRHENVRYKWIRRRELLNKREKCTRK